MIVTVTNIRNQGSKKPNLEFTYDAQQRRLTKRVIPNVQIIMGGGTITDNSITTIYTYDAGGNLMATYEKTFNITTSSYDVKLLEHYVYGLTCLGAYKQDNATTVNKTKLRLCPFEYPQILIFCFFSLAY